MNKIYKTIRRAFSGETVVASELARGCTKRGYAAGSRVDKRTGTGSPTFGKVWAAKALSALSIALIGTSAIAQTTVPAGDNIGAVLNAGNYNLLLGGDVVWGTAFTVNTAAKKTVTIDGAGRTITLTSTANLFIGNTASVATSADPLTLTIKNAKVTQASFTGPRYGAILINTANVHGVLNLEGTSFENIRPSNYAGFASADYGPIINMRPAGGTLTVSGGANGVTFSGNSALADQPGVAGVYGGTLSFSDKVTFDSNWTADYGGAVSVFEGAGTSMTFSGTTLFKTNHASVFGGAIDMWGNNSTLIFNSGSNTTFEGNFVYTIDNSPTWSVDFPNHVLDQHASGGVLNIGYVGGTASTASATFNGTALFDGNYVINMKPSANATRNALGGAISLHTGAGVDKSYALNLNAATTFRNNYVYSLNGSGFGGAIYASTLGAVNIGSGVSFLNNTAQTSGGAIYIKNAQLNLNAATTDIIFQGNRQGATFSPFDKTLVGGTYTFYQPDANTGTPNAIYWDNTYATTHTLSLNAATGTIHFYDPLGSATNVVLTVNKNGTGEVIFHGDNGLTTNYDSNINATTNVNAGTFTLDGGVTYGRSNVLGTFNVNDTATLQGSFGSTLRVNTIAATKGSHIRVNGGIFTLDATNINLGTGASVSSLGIEGYGTLTATSNLNLLSDIAVTVDADGGGNPYSLTLNGRLTGAFGVAKYNTGILVVPVAQAYTTTLVTGGTWRITADGTLGTGSVTLLPLGTLEILNPNTGNYTLTNSMIGSGLLKVGLSNSSNTFNFATTAGTAFAGRVELNNSTFNLAGTNTSALTNATLELNAGNTTTVGTGTQSIGNLTLSGGTLDYGSATSGTIATGTLTLTSGQVRLDTSTLVDSTNLLQQDEGINKLLVSATTVVGSAGNLTLVDTAGNPLTSDLTNIIQGGNTVAIGTYQYGLTTGTGNDGLYTSYQLSQLDLQNGQTLTLSGDATTPAGAADLKARIIGAGNLNINATNSITLNNSTNDYTGATQVSGGTLILGSDNALGQTSGLTLNSGTTANINGMTQSIGSLAGQGTLAMGGGNLTVTNGGTFGGVITDTTGQLNLSGTTPLILTGNNTYTGGTAVASGATLAIGNGGATGSYAGNITNDGVVRFNRTADLTYSGVISGTGVLNKQGSNTLYLSTANSYTGGTTINAGTLQLGNAQGAGTGDINLTAPGATLSLGFNNAHFVNNITNTSGGIVKVISSGVWIDGNNSNFAGTWDITGSALISNANNLGAGSLVLNGLLNIEEPTSGSYSFTNALSGNGTMVVNLLNATDTFNFAASAGSAFTGAVELNTSTFNLAGINTSALTNALLVLVAGNTTTVGTGIQNIGNLNFHSGTLDVSSATSGTIATDTLNLIGGNVRLSASTIVDNGSNLLLQDDGINKQLVSATTVIGSAGNLTLVDASGNPLTNGQSNITEGGNNVAIGHYQYGLTTGVSNNGLYASYQLTGLDLQGGQTLTLSGDATIPASAADMKAQITGAGNLNINATNSITINNATNNYTGATQVSGGTLILGSNSALGQTSGLTLNAGTTADLNGNSQSIGGLAGQGTLAMNNGALLVTNGGTFAGVIAGINGQLNLNGSTLTLTGSNTYTGNTSVASGTTLAIGSGGTSGSYAGDINNDGAVNFNRNDNSVYTGSISGTGTLNKSGTGVLSLTNTNMYSGTTTVSAGTLRLTGNGALGTGGVQIASAGTFEILNPNSANYTFNNALAGAGLLRVDLGSSSNTFDFTAGTGTLFAGKVELNNSTFNLTGTNTSALTNATLQLNDNNTTTVGAGTQSIGNLTINGGSLKFDNLPTGLINTGALALNSGIVQVADQAAQIVSGSLLQQDDGTNRKQLITATSVTGQAGNLTLQDLSGNSLSTLDSNITQGGNFVAIGTYSTDLTSDNAGLYLAYQLTQLDLQNSQTLTLDGDTAVPAGAADMKARIIGSGNLNIDATNSITLNNATNSYTGATQVSGGTMILGSNNALGQTSGLTLNASTTADINGKSQSIGSLAGQGTLAMNSGNLTITTGGTFAGVIAGASGQLTLDSGSALTLTGSNTYTGNTAVTSGASMTIGTGTSGSYAGNITNDGAVNFNRNDTNTYASVISGSGILNQNSGVLVLTGNNTYTGGTTIATGSAIELGAGGTTGIVSGNITNNGILRFNRSDDITYSGLISGSGVVTKQAGNTLTLNVANSYSGSTNVTAGTLQLDHAQGAGTGYIDLTATGTTLDLNFSDASFANAVANTSGGTVKVTGSNITLTANNTGFGGTWQVDGSANVTNANNLGSGNVALSGLLNIQPASGNYSFANALSGNGQLNVTMGSAASTFDFTAGAGTAFTGTAVFNNGAFNLGGANTSALTNATLQLNDNNTTTVGAGTQNIGNLVMNGGNLAFAGTLPPGSSATGLVNVNDLTLTSGEIRVSIPTSGIVNPIPAPGLNLLEQDEGDIVAQLIGANGSISGDISNITLADQNGNTIASSQVLAVTEGANTVANATYNFGLTTGLGNDGVYFNYGLTQLELLSAQTLHLAPNSGASSNNAMMSAKLTGVGNLDVNGSAASDQAIVLNNSNNDYTGSTTVSGGTLKLGTDNALGQTSLLSILGGATTDINSKTQSIGALGGTGSLNVNSGHLTITNGGTFAGTIIGTGDLNLSGNTLTLTGSNTYTGNTTVALGATLAIGSGGTSGNYAGNITNSGDVNFNRSDSMVYAGVIDGSGDVNQNGSGVQIFTGDHTYTGSTHINAGTLQLGNGGTSGSVASNIVNSSELVFNRSDSVTYEGVVSGSGNLSQNGSGTLILTGNHVYTGTTDINAGTLQLGNGGTSGSLVGDITNNANLVINRSDDITLSQVISGTGAVQHNGTGTTTLTGVNTYSGITTVNDGILRLTSNGSIGAGSVVLSTGGTMLIDAPSGGNYTFNNALSGTGTLVGNLSASNNVFDFAASAGNAFAGTFKLAQGNIDLDTANNVNALSHATLELGSNGSADLLNSNQTIGNLTFNGGLLNVGMVNANTAYVLTVDHLNVDHPDAMTLPGTINLDVASLGSGITPTGNLLLQGQVDPSNGIKVIDASTVSSEGKQLELQLNGSVPVDTTFTISDGYGNTDVKATYGYMAVTTASPAPGETGLYVGYVLKVLESVSNVILDSTGAVNASMGAQLTGAGNFEFRSNNDSITLLNSTNDYTGATTLSSGTLYLGASNVLGQTSALNVASGATVDMNGMSQTVGQLNNQNGSTINFNGGHLTVSNGGTAVGQLTGAGQLTISGGVLSIQNANTGLTATTNIASPATALLSNVAGLGSGGVTLDGTLEFNNASGNFSNNLVGAGAVQVNNSSHVVLVGDNSSYSGNIGIAAGNSINAVSANSLGTSTIANSGQLILSSTSDWTFTNAMTGIGEMVKLGSGIVRISNDYQHTGGTHVQAGTLALDSNMAGLTGGGPVTIDYGARLGGYGTILGNVTNHGILAVGDAIQALTGGAGELVIRGNLSNQGAVVLAGNNVGNKLTVMGDYSAASDLVLNTQLGDDNSPTDKLVVQGSTYGHTMVTVNNVGGTGGQTHNGIQIVQVHGSSDGTFELASRVVTGAYDYLLYQGSIDNPYDGAWYLRVPEITPIKPVVPIRPEIGAYMANQDAAIDMFRHSMHDRFGDSQFVAGRLGEDTAPSVWVRSDAYHLDSRAAGQIDQSRWGTAFQMGSDVVRDTTDNGNWRLGVMGGYGSSKSRNHTDGESIMARSDMSGYSVGVYGTWFADGETGSEGPYADTWVQYGWYNNNVQGDKLAGESYRSRTVMGSIEGGWTFKVHENEDARIFVQPQAQLTYARYRGSNFYEQNGTLIQSRNDSGLISRVGVRAFGYTQTNESTRLQVFVETNWLHNDTGAGVSMNYQPFDSDLPRNIFELKTGVEVRVNDRWNIWGSIGTQQGHNDYMRVGGTIGLKYSW